MERKAVCNKCGHEWYPRSTNTPKPFKCSRCNSRDVFWADQEQFTNTPPEQHAPSQYAQVSEPQVNNNMYYDQPRRLAEPERDHAAAAEVLNAFKQEVKQALHESLPQAVVQQVPPYSPYGYYPPMPTMSPEDKEDLDYYRDVEYDKERLAESLKDAFGDDTQIIESPSYDIDLDRDTRVAFKDPISGEKRAGTLISDERLYTLHEAEAAIDNEIKGDTAIEHMKQLNEEANALEQVKDKLPKVSKKRSGVPAWVLGAGLCVVGYFLIVRPIIKSLKANKEAEQEAKNTVSAGNERYVPTNLPNKYYQVFNGRA